MPMERLVTVVCPSCSEIILAVASSLTAKATRTAEFAMMDFARQ